MFCRHEGRRGLRALARLWGLAFTFLFLLVANLLEGTLANATYSVVLAFFNANIGIMIAMAILGAVGDLAYAAGFPAKMIGPVIHAFNSILGVYFACGLFGVLGRALGIGALVTISSLAPIFYPLFFVLTLLIGYAGILFCGMLQAARLDEETYRDYQKLREEIARERRASGGKEKHTWREVGDELKGTIYDSLVEARKSIRKGGNSGRAKARKRKAARRR